MAYLPRIGVPAEHLAGARCLECFHAVDDNDRYNGTIPGERPCQFRCLCHPYITNHGGLRGLYADGFATRFVPLSTQRMRELERQAADWDRHYPYVHLPGPPNYPNPYDYPFPLPTSTVLKRTWQVPGGEVMLLGPTRMGDKTVTMALTIQRSGRDRIRGGQGNESDHLRQSLQRLVNHGMPIDRGTQVNLWDTLREFYGRPPFPGEGRDLPRYGGLPGQIPDSPGSRVGRRNTPPVEYNPPLI